MVFQRRVNLLVGILFSLLPKALQAAPVMPNGRYLAENLNDSFSVDRSTMSYSGPDYYPNKTSRVQFVLPAFVVHGFQPDPSVAAAMPRKIIANGDEVVTPGAGLEYKNPNGLLVVGAVLKDCFDDLAATFQIGGNWRINHDSDWGLTAGVYVRQTPLVCPPNVTNPNNCYSVDGLTFKYVTYISGQSVDIIPLPFLHYSYNLYRSREMQINLKVMANFFLNEVGIEIPL